MELSTILLFVGILACPIAMGVMMWMMNRNMGGEHSHPMEGDASHTDHLQTLHEHRRVLEQEIAEIEKIAALTAQKEALAHASENSPDGQPQPVETPHHGP